MIYHKILENNKVSLRALEPSDVEVLYKWENNTNYWLVSSTITPFSKDILKKYIDNSDQDIYAVKQLRLMIDAKDIKKTIGAIDLFDFDPNNRRAGVGILISEEFSDQSYGKEALKVLIKYAFDVLNLHQLYCNIALINKASIKLFESAGFVKTGLKKEWLRTPDKWVDEAFFQIFNTTNTTGI